MSVRSRTWTTTKGVEKTAWVADYVDAKGKRALKTFDNEADAIEFAERLTRPFARERLASLRLVFRGMLDLANRERDLTGDEIALMRAQLSGLLTELDLTSTNSC